MKTIIHYATVPAMIALFLFWKIGDSAGAGNMFQVLFWFIYPLAAAGSMLNLSSPEKMSETEKQAYSKGRWFSRVVALCMFTVTAWYGHHVMAVLVMLNIALGAALHGKILEQHKPA